MAGIENDYYAVQTFRSDLLQVVDNLRAQLRQTEQAVETVSASWDDVQFCQYEKEFSKDVELIEPLCKDLEAFESEVLFPLQELLKTYTDL